MTINTGVYIPGGKFIPNQLIGIVGNQVAAINKGAYDDIGGVKQRILVVDNDAAKEELQKQLLNAANFQRVDQTVPNRPDLWHSHKARTLSNRVITAGEYNQQKEAGGFKFNKLYIDASSMGCTAGAFSINEPKEASLKKGFITGAATGLLASAACKLAGASGSSILEGGAIGATAGFAWGYISQSRKPDIESKIVTTLDMAKTLDHKGLQCADIRILSFNSGDRTRTDNITSAESRRRARTMPANKLALDESMAGAIAERHPHKAGNYEVVQGYQGECGYMGIKTETIGHIARKSTDMRLQSPVEREVRQSAARVQTVIWP